jgi:hypothetical protein
VGLRINEPCTGLQYALPESAVIITHTDLESRITYANEAFIEIERVRARGVPR